MSSDWGGRYHLRRVSGDGRTIPENLILLDDLTRFGRNPETVDVVLTSAVYSNMISRDHAKIIGQVNSRGFFDGYVITDKSLNGTYVNDIRVKDTIELKENDIVKFGHMNGAAIKAGTTAPQANAEFTFTFEKASPGVPYLGCDSRGRRIHTLICSGGGQPLQTGPARAIQPPADPAPSQSRPQYHLVQQQPPLPVPPAHQPQTSLQQPSPIHHAHSSLATGMAGLSNLSPALLMQMQQQITQGAANAQYQAVFHQLLANQRLQHNPNSALFNPTFLMQLQQQQSALAAPAAARLPIPDGIPPTSIGEGLHRVDCSAAMNSLGGSRVKAEEERQPIGSPPMECDSSVPSPPKPPPLPSKNSPRHEEESLSVPDSPPRAPAPQQNAIRSMTNSPSPSFSTDTATKLTSSGKPITPQPPIKSPPNSTKRNEVERLIKDLDSFNDSPAEVQRRRSVSSATTTAASRRRPSEDARKKAKKEAKQHKLLRQLSDLSSEGTDDEGEMPEKKRTTKEKTQRKAMASASHSDGDFSSDAEDDGKKKKKSSHKSSAAKKELKVKLKLPSTGRGRKKKEAASEVLPVQSALPQVDMSYEDDVDQPCESSMCSKPKDDMVQWIQCDECDKWYHSICIFGSANLPQILPKKFECGCKKEKMKKEQKLRKRRKKSEDSD